MLHIITPLYRFEYLERVYDSILMNDDIRWHISKSTRREELNCDFIKSDKRVKLYEIDCEDSDTPSKRNVILENIQDGYFCFLDDDTVFHENMYSKYLECVDHNFVGMIVGQQIGNNNRLRLIASKPVFRRIDTGNVLSHTSCLEQCKWPLEYTPNVNQRDFLFWNSVFEFYDKKCGIWNQPISYYNKLRITNYDSKEKNKCSN